MSAPVLNCILLDKTGTFLVVNIPLSLLLFHQVIAFSPFTLQTSHARIEKGEQPRNKNQYLQLKLSAIKKDYQITSKKNVSKDILASSVSAVTKLLHIRSVQPNSVGGWYRKEQR